MDNELKPLPCPFCGDTPVVMCVGGWSVSCCNLDHSMVIYTISNATTTREEAIAIWNRRAPVGEVEHV